jgi:hypothetical protein
MGRKFEQEIKEENGVSATSFTKFLDSYSQMLWFSYRKDFPSIEDSLYLAHLRSAYIIKHILKFFFFIFLLL